MGDVPDRLKAALADRYRIERELGAGGMATVYLAEDLRHHRKVAIKVLRPELAAVVGAERFLAEIETTANLQHPHILPLFDSGQADTFLFYVMPYVESESLRERLDRERQLPIDEAVRIASDLAEALGYAHRKGVIHRDIKPANVLLLAGQPVIADFGIALAVGAAGGGRLTETGLSLGTPHYMSPEQATGAEHIGPATDIYALGCVLYEMLVGQPPYTGATAQAVLGKIIGGTADPVSAHRKTVPANVDAAIQKALERVPADRFAQAGEFAKALGAPEFRYRPAAVDAAHPPRGRWVGAAAALIFVILASGATAWSVMSADPPQPISKHVLSTDGWSGLGSEIGRLAAIAPDGSSMILPLDGRLGLKLRGSTEIQPIPGTERARDVVYSPDGRWIAYAVGTEVFKRPLGGGSAIRLAQDAEDEPLRVAIAWLDDGTILHETVSRAIARVGDSGELSSTVMSPPGLLWMEPLPNAQGALAAGSDQVLYALDLERSELKPVLDGVLRAWYVPSGHLVYVGIDGTVLAAPFDLGTLEITGAVTPIFSGVRVTQDRADVRLAANGSLLFVQGSGAPDQGRALVWVTREGDTATVPGGERIQWGSGANHGVRLSPDGRIVALTHTADGNVEIWTKALPDGSLSRLTFDEAPEQAPAWTPDGRSLLFGSARGSDSSGVPGQVLWRLWLQPANGTGDARLIYGNSAHPMGEGVWSPDGRWLVMRRNATAGFATNDIVGLRPDVDTVAVPLVASEFTEQYPAVSRDGKWLAYSSNETGRFEVYVRPFPDVSGGKWLVSTDGGTEPVWAHNGRELFFVDPSTYELRVAAFSTAVGVFERGKITTLFRDSTVTSASMGPLPRTYDVMPDDQRFLMTRALGGGDDLGSNRLILVENFFDELEGALSR
jgi:serine/threonine protein kinase/WD40 repeat protein